MKKPVIAAIIIAWVGAGAAASAMAASEDEKADQAEKQEALASAKVSIADAIKAAEASAGGKVAEVEFDNDEGTAAYEVSVIMADGIKHEVQIDANSGEVMKTVVDDEDNDQGEDDD